MIQPPRSRFMITDILSSDARDALIKHHNHYLGLQVSSNSSDGRRLRSRSPHESNHHNNGGMQGDRHEDSDSDLSGGSDDHSDMCSNGGKDEDGNSMNSSLELNGTHGLSKKQRKARTAFTDNQLQTLEKTFERQKYLSVQDRMEMANKLGLNDTQVKTWYQNRRTKWKRQTAVGLELLAEAGNYAAFQRLYGTPPFTGAWPYGGQGPPGAQPTAADIYYRQAAVAAMQKPHPYRMYPDVHPSLGALSAMASQNTPFQHLSAFSSLSSLSNLYHHNAGSGHTINSGGSPPVIPVAVPHPTSSAPAHPHSSPARSPSPTLDPGSPPGRSSNHSHASDDEESIHV